MFVSCVYHLTFIIVFENKTLSGCEVFLCTDIPKLDSSLCWKFRWFPFFIPFADAPSILGPSCSLCRELAHQLSRDPSPSSSWKAQVAFLSPSRFCGLVFKSSLSGGGVRAPFSLSPLAPLPIIVGRGWRVRGGTWARRLLRCPPGSWAASAPSAPAVTSGTSCPSAWGGVSVEAWLTVAVASLLQDRPGAGSSCGSGALLPALA